MAIPQHLASTHRMLVSAFPEGVAGDEYLAVIGVLKRHMSARNLAEVMVLAFGSYGVTCEGTYNDIGRAPDRSAEFPEVIGKVRTRLLAAGYERWVVESDAEG